MDHKPSKLALLIGVGRHDDGGGDEPSGEDMSKARDTAFDEFFDALMAKDKARAREAYDVLCAHEEPDGDEDGGDYEQ